MTLDDPYPRFQRHAIIRRLISNIANTVLCVITKDKRPSTLTGRNVRLSDLLISSC